MSGETESATTALQVVENPPKGYEEDGPTAGEIWSVLSKVDVSEYTEELNKGKYSLTYLSWTHAVTLMMTKFPEFNYTFLPDEIHQDGSVTVRCVATIGHVRREMWLPVMDHKNAALINPNARAISDAKQRCLVKAIAIFGLGLNVYAGEDLPIGESVEVKTLESGGATEEQKAGYEATVTAALTFIEDCPDVKKLKAYWDKYSDEFKRISKAHPEAYDNLIAGFKAKRVELAEEKK